MLKEIKENVNKWSSCGPTLCQLSKTNLKSYLAKNPPVCNLCSGCSKFYLWNKPDHQKTEYSDYIFFKTQLHFIVNPRLTFYRNNMKLVCFWNAEDIIYYNMKYLHYGGPKKKLFLRPKVHKTYQFSRSSSRPMELMDSPNLETHQISNLALVAS